MNSFVDLLGLRSSPTCSSTWYPMYNTSRICSIIVIQVVHGTVPSTGVRRPYL